MTVCVYYVDWHLTCPDDCVCVLCILASDDCVCVYYVDWHLTCPDDCVCVLCILASDVS